MSKMNFCGSSNSHVEFLTQQNVCTVGHFFVVIQSLITVPLKKFGNNYYQSCPGQDVFSVGQVTLHSNLPIEQKVY